MSTEHRVTTLDAEPPDVEDVADHIAKMVRDGWHLLACTRAMRNGDVWTAFIWARHPEPKP